MHIYDLIRCMMYIMINIILIHSTINTSSTILYTHYTVIYYTIYPYLTILYVLYIDLTTRILGVQSKYVKVIYNIIILVKYIL